MPILMRNRFGPAAIHCVREARVGIPIERRVEISVFYRGTLGLRPWPQDQQIPGGWGAGDLRRGVYFQYRHDPHVDPMRRRLVLIVHELDAVEERLRERDWPYARRRGLCYTDQCILVNDPVGHRLELRQLQPL